VIRDELVAHWAAEALSSAPDAYEGRRVQQVRAFEVYAGLDRAGSRRFVAIRLDGNERKTIGDRYPRSSRGIVVESVEGGAGRVAFFLREQAGIPESVFPTVMDDVLATGQSAATGRELRTAFERFASWQSALSRQAGAMSDQEVRGIIGELVVARDVLAPCIGNARLVQVWRSPEDDHVHDFVGQNWELEVKTVLVPGTQFHVNADGQLEPEPGNRMFLTSVELERDDEGVSLLELVEQFQALGDGDAPTGEAFRNALVRRGALSASIDGAASSRYRVRSIGLLEVKEGFPLIPRKSLPAGVSDVEYRISLPACSRFALDPQELKVALETMEYAK
jgi:hypothetical protein